MNNEIIKEMIKEINKAIYNNEISYSCAFNLIYQIGELNGRDYFINNKRVVYKDENGQLMDAWVNA